jgi:hypothetical protein
MSTGGKVLQMGPPSAERNESRAASGPSKAVPGTPVPFDAAARAFRPRICRHRAWTAPPSASTY